MKRLTTLADGGLVKDKPKVCRWKYEDVDDYWKAACGDRYFSFNEGGLKENHFEFCPFCGKQIKQVGDNHE